MSYPSTLFSPSSSFNTSFNTSLSSTTPSKAQELFTKKLPSYSFVKYFRILITTWIGWKLIFAIYWSISSLPSATQMPSTLKILVGEPLISHQKSIMDLLPPQDKYTVKMVWILFMWSSILSIFFTFFLLYSPLLGSLSWFNIICMGLEIVPLVLLVWMYRKVPGMINLSTSSESTTTTTVYQYKLVVFIFLFIYALGLVAFVIYWISASFQEFLQRFTAAPTRQLVQKTKFDSTHFLFDPLSLINARFTNNTILSSKYSDLQFLGFETSTCKTLQKDSVPGYPSVSKFITPLILKYSALSPSNKRETFYVKMGIQELILSKPNSNGLSEYGVKFITNGAPSGDIVSDKLETLLRCSSTPTNLITTTSPSITKTLTGGFKSLFSTTPSSKPATPKSSTFSRYNTLNNPYSSYSFSYPSSYYGRR